MKKIIFGLLSFSVQLVAAQKSVKLEQLRCFSTVGPVMSYWEIPEVKRAFITDLKQALAQYRHFALTDTISLNIQLLNSGDEAGTVKPVFTDPDTSHVHLYLDFYELDVPRYFSYAGKAELVDTGIQKRANSIFVLKASWVNSFRKILSSEELHIIASPTEATGFGNLYTIANGYKSTPPTPKGFNGILQKGMAILFSPGNDRARRVEMKVPQAYMTDNFILPKIYNQPKIYAITKKGVSMYTYRDTAEIIRMGDQQYEEILIKGKKILKYPDALMDEIKSTFHYATSDFVFLRQECRDVVRDRNYLIKLTTQIDPEYQSADSENMFTNFLTGKFHYLLAEKDTVAIFTVTKRVKDNTGKKIFSFRVSNGYDSASFPIADWRKDPLPVIYNYVVSGRIRGSDFSIECSGQANNLKEIYFNGKLVCIADGLLGLEKFVVFDASLSPQILNELFMIGFNRFFV